MEINAKPELLAIIKVGLDLTGEAQRRKWWGAKKIQEGLYQRSSVGSHSYFLIALVWGLSTEKFLKFSKRFLCATKIENHSIRGKWDQLNESQPASPLKKNLMKEKMECITITKDTNYLRNLCFSNMCGRMQVCSVVKQNALISVVSF